MRNALFSATLVAGCLTLAASAANGQGKLYGSDGYGVLDEQGGSRLFGIIPTNEYLRQDLKISDAQLKRMREILLQLAKPSQLFARKTVVDELRITNGQKQKARELQRDYRKKHVALMKEYVKERAQKRQPDLDAVDKRRNAYQRETELAIFKLLTREQRDRFRRLVGKPIDRRKILVPFLRRGKSVLLGEVADNKALQQELRITNAQLQRMREIELQLMDPSDLFWQKDVFDTLRITKKQREQDIAVRQAALQKLNTLMDNYRKEQAENKKPSFDDLQKRRNKIQQETDEAILKLLTPAQRKRFERLMGKPLDLKKLLRRKSKLRADI